MSQLRKLQPPVSTGVLPPLAPSFRSTFQTATYWPALVPRGARLYRYGSTQQQVRSSTQEWINFSEDCLPTSEEVIQRLCLLDFTDSDLGERDPLSGAALPGRVVARGGPSGPNPPRPWNTAALRGAFRATDEVYAWAGLAGPMAFDVFTGKRYQGRGDQMPHISRPGGGSQVLVHRGQLVKLELVEITPLARVRYLS
ncbi:MAG: hypothetical protein H0U67_05200 [Gemmatimonadetes bacterium]|nr:hypothetical protein [Gemmatimonadota bacterium]